MQKSQLWSSMWTSIYLNFSSMSSLSSPFSPLQWVRGYEKREQTHIGWETGSIPNSSTATSRSWTHWWEWSHLPHIMARKYNSGEFYHNLPDIFLKPLWHVHCIWLVHKVFHQVPWASVKSQWVRCHMIMFWLVTPNSQPEKKSWKATTAKKHSSNT